MSAHHSSTAAYNERQPDFIIRKKRGPLTGSAFYKKRGYTSDAAMKKNVIYQGKHDLGNGEYDVEIFTTGREELFITSQHIGKADSYVIEIEPQKVESLAKEFNNDFALMACHLKIMNKRMVLLNPKFGNNGADTN